MENKVDLDKLKQSKSINELLEFCIINIDKPSGPTSFNVSDYVRETLNKAGLKISKTSHFGTLDPKVTGVLPIAINRACKLTGYFLGSDKTYVGVMRLHKETDIEKLKEVIKNKFLGKIKQTPPVRSSVKRQEREREIYDFEILERDENKKDFLFKCKVQGGTYIRKLIDDLGTQLGIGAHMIELRRTKAGIFEELRGNKDKNKEYPSITLYDLDKTLDEYKKGNKEPLKGILIPAEIITEIFPSIQVKKESVKKLLTGKPLLMIDVINKLNFNKESLICAFNDGQFIGTYKIIDINPKAKNNEILAKPEFVLQPIK